MHFFESQLYIFFKIFFNLNLIDFLSTFLIEYKDTTHHFNQYCCMRWPNDSLAWQYCWPPLSTYMGQMPRTNFTLQYCDIYFEISLIEMTFQIIFYYIAIISNLFLSLAGSPKQFNGPHITSGQYFAISWSKGFLESVLKQMLMRAANGSGNANCARAIISTSLWFLYLFEAVEVVCGDEILCGIVSALFHQPGTAGWENQVAKK